MATAPVEPVLVTDLFRPDREALLALLRGLTDEDWARATVCSGWTVKDVALHILGVDLANISGRRDGQWPVAPREGENFGSFIDRINHEWVDASRRLSTDLLVELLAWSGPPLFGHFAEQDPLAQGAPVTWAGPGPAPVWLDVAREYTERWIHQQQIRDAVLTPGQTEPRFLHPVIATFVHAVPVALAGVGGEALVLDIAEAGIWSAVEEDGWRLRAGAHDEPTATVHVDAETVWRAFSLGIDAGEAAARVRIDGDEQLARAALRAVAIVAPPRDG